MGKNFRLTGIIILCLILAASAAAGCGKLNGKDEGTTGITSGSSTASSGTETSEAKPGIVDNSKLKTLKIFSEIAPETAQTCKDLNDHEVFKELEKRTGVHVEWIHPTAEEQFNLMIASREYPDLIRANWPSIAGGCAKYADDGVIIVLNDLIDKYAPDFKEVLKNTPAIKRSILNPNGNYYYIPQAVISPENNLYKGPIMRLDWLEKLNLDVPTTVDELYEVLKAFKERDPNGNNEKDEWPMSGGGSYANKSNSAHCIGNISWAWHTTIGFYHKEGKIQYGPLDPQFKDALMYTRKLFEEGLLDPDYVLNDRNKLDAKVMDNKVGFCYHYQPTNFMTKMAEKDPNFKIGGIPYPKGPDGTAGVFDSALIATVTGGGCMAITTACEYPEEAMKWLNYAFSKEGHLLFNFGIENESYTLVNGEPVYTDLINNNPDGLTKATAIGKWSMALHKWPIVQDVGYYRQYVVTDYSRDSINTWANSITDDPFKWICPALPKTKEEGDKISVIISEIDTYKAEMCDKFVLGKEPVEKYDEFVETLKKMKIQEAIDLTQKIFDRYNAN